MDKYLAYQKVHAEALAKEKVAIFKIPADDEKVGDLKVVAS